MFYSMTPLLLIWFFIISVFFLHLFILLYRFYRNLKPGIKSLSYLIRLINICTSSLHIFIFFKGFFCHYDFRLRWCDSVLNSWIYSLVTIPVVANARSIFISSFNSTICSSFSSKICLAAKALTVCSVSASCSPETAIFPCILAFRFISSCFLLYDLFLPVFFYRILLSI